MLAAAAVATGAFGHAVVDAFLATLERSSDATGVVFDVGANDGAWTRWLLARAARRGAGAHGRLRVHAFEPQPRYGGVLRALARESGGSVRVHRAAAVATAAAAVRFYPSGDAQAASLLPSMASAYSADGGRRAPIRVAAVDLAAFVRAETNASSVALLKCDVEGGEYALLPRLVATGALCRARHLLVEWHLNALPAKDRLAGLGLRLGFDALLRAGCADPERGWHVQHDDYAKNNVGEAVDGLAAVCARRNTTHKRTRWTRAARAEAR